MTLLTVIPMGCYVDNRYVHVVKGGFRWTRREMRERSQQSRSVQQQHLQEHSVGEAPARRPGAIYSYAMMCKVNVSRKKHNINERNRVRE